MRRLPAALRRAVEQARGLARERGASLHVVGGAVRDLLLRRQIVDVDLVVDSDAVGFAGELARRLEAPLRRHDRFGTATIALAGGHEIDVATRRRERYARPGALPSVEPGTLEEDLARRDFTINAMALDLSARGAPRLLDPLGGGRDLEARLVRIIHPGSPDDDPTRGFRAARYANRLGFRLEARTARWIRESAERGAVATISGDRLLRELEHLLGEPRPGRAVSLLAALGLARAVLPALPVDAAARNRLDAAARIAARLGAPTAAAILLAWAARLSPRHAAGLARALGLSGGAAERLARWPATVARISAAAAGGKPSRLDGLLAGLLPEQVAAAAAGLPPARRRALMRANALRATMKPRFSGGELVAAGLPPGPWIARALAQARAARLDGTIDPREEKDYAISKARRLAARVRGARRRP